MSTTIELDRRALQAIRPLDLASYLHAHGWQQAHLIADKGAVWTHRDGQDEYEILLPLTSELGDYYIRLREALHTLALHERRPIGEVWEDVTTTSADVVRIQVIRTDLDDGSLPLPTAVRLADGLQNLLRAAACAALEPSSTPHEPVPMLLQEFLERIRLRQGNDKPHYTITLVSRVPPRLETTGNGTCLEEPFERRVLICLARALAEAREVTNRVAARHPGAVETAFSDGVSANLYRALAVMGGDIERLSALRFAFSWSPGRPPSADVPRAIRFGPDNLALLAELGRSPSDGG